MIDDVIARIDKAVYGFDTSKLSTDEMKNLNEIIDAKNALDRQRKQLQAEESDDEPSEISVLRRRWIALREAQIDEITSKGLKHVDNAGLAKINKIYKKIEEYNKSHGR